MTTPPLIATQVSFPPPPEDLRARLPFGLDKSRASMTKDNDEWIS